MVGVVTCLHAVANPQPPGTEAVCGYGMQLVSVPAGRARSGLSVELLAGDATVGQTVPLRFRVRQLPGDAPVEDLQVEHERLMHVIGVRDDLTEFFHLHPIRNGPGLWQALHTFTNGGRYRIWADVKRRGTVYSFAQPALTVAGRMQPGMALRANRIFENAGYATSLRLPERVRSGTTNQLELVVRDSVGRQAGLEFFLGALMHVVVLKDDLSVYLHGHAENHDKSQPTVVVNQFFPQPGNYKLFAQFRPMKSRLAPDESLLAEFWINVPGAD